MNIQDKLEAALQSEQPEDELQNLVVELHAQGNSQKEIYLMFEDFRDHLRRHNRESDEDKILDVMDVIVGWCSPHCRIFEEYLET